MEQQGVRVSLSEREENIKRTNRSDDLPSIYFDGEYKESNYYHFYKNLQRQYQRSRSITGLSSPFYTCEFECLEITIDCEMNDSCVESKWTQLFKNTHSKTPIEARYSFPLNSKTSIISNFSIEYLNKNNEKVILHGKIKEKSRSIEIYNDSMASGNQSIRVENSDDMYHFMVGNLPPNKEITIKFTVVQELNTHKSAYHYLIHHTSFPTDVLNKFQFNMNINLSNTTIKTIKFLNHYELLNEEPFKLNENQSTIGLKAENRSNLFKDLLIVIEPNEINNKPNSVIEFNNSNDNNTMAVTLNLYPSSFKDIEKEDIVQKSEFLFLVDCSLSMMSGLSPPIKKSKNVLNIIMKSLSEGQHKFNIICFGSEYRKLFIEVSSKLYSQETLEEACIFIDLIKANMGGTDLYPPLTDILEMPVDNNYPRQLFIITDGEVKNTEKLIKYVEKNVNTTRIFTFGIGDEVDYNLVIGLSRAARGMYELIRSSSNIEEQVMKLLNASFEPTLSNIKIDWKELSSSLVYQTPQIRPLFNEERMMVYALFNNINERDIQNQTIVLTGDGPTGEVVRIPILLEFNKAIKSTQTHTIVAHKYIQDLEEVENNENNRYKIIELSKKYSIPSKYTSFIVCGNINNSEDDKVTNESMKLVKLKINRHSDRSRGGGMGIRSDLLNSFSNRSISRSNSGNCERLSLKSRIDAVKNDRSSKSSKINFNTSGEKRSKSATINNDELINILKFQLADGSWVYKSMVDLIDSKNISIPDLLKLEKYSQLENERLLNVWITFLIVSKISKEHQDKKQLWTLSISKSIKYLKKELKSFNLPPDSYENLLVLSKQRLD